MQNVREKVYLSFFQDRSLTAHSILTPLLTSSSSILNWFTGCSLAFYFRFYQNKFTEWLTLKQWQSHDFGNVAMEGENILKNENDNEIWRKWSKEVCATRFLNVVTGTYLYILIGLPTYHRRLFHKFFSIPLISGMEKNLWNRRLCYLPILSAPGGT